MNLLPNLLLKSPEAVAFLVMASGFLCFHQGGLYVIQEEVYCRDCSGVLGSVWDEVGVDSFDGFHEAYSREVDNVVELAPATLYEIDEEEVG